MADHPGRENRIPWNPIHDTLPYWSVDDDSAFIALKPAAEHSNRVSASRLYELAQLFGVPVSYFYKGMEEGMDAPSPEEVLTKRETLELVKADTSISNRAARDKIRKLVQAAAKIGVSPDTSRESVRCTSKAVPKKPAAKASRRASPAQAREFDRSKIDGRTKVGRAALAALKKRGRKSKTDLEALAAVGYPGAAAKLAER